MNIWKSWLTPSMTLVSIKWSHELQVIGEWKHQHFSSGNYEKWKSSLEKGGCNSAPLEFLHNFSVCLTIKSQRLNRCEREKQIAVSQLVCVSLFVGPQGSLQQFQRQRARVILGGQLLAKFKLLWQYGQKNPLKTCLQCLVTRTLL